MQLRFMNKILMCHNVFKFKLKLQDKVSFEVDYL